MAAGPCSAAEMGVNVNCLFAVWAVGTLESVTVMVNVELGGGVVVDVGVPVISPVVVFKLKPARSAPEETLQVRGAVPPVTVRIWS